MNQPRFELGTFCVAKNCVILTDVLTNYATNPSPNWVNLEL